MPPLTHPAAADDIAWPSRTSRPEWPPSPPALPPGATAWTLLSLGSPSGEPLARWRRDLAAMTPQPPASVVEIDREALDGWLALLPLWFAAEAARHVVGWRIAVAGEERAVLAVAAAARSAGLLPTEMVLHADVATGKRVYCPSCSAVTDAAGDDRVRCGGCGRLLVIQPHCSRRRGAYLGTLVHEAKEPGDA